MTSYLGLQRARDPKFPQVEVNKVCYTPSTTSDTKKTAKAAAAEHCLRELGMLPKILDGAAVPK